MTEVSQMDWAIPKRKLHEIVWICSLAGEPSVYKAKIIAMKQMIEDSYVGKNSDGTPNIVYTTCAPEECFWGITVVTFVMEKGMFDTKEAAEAELASKLKYEEEVIRTLKKRHSLIKM